jgi:hypothetical protein
MAKTAAEYIAEGRALYAASTDKTQPFPHAKSWQQKATNEGFMLAFADDADKQACERTAAAVLTAEVQPTADTAMEEVTLRLPKKTVADISRLPPPNSMMHAFTDTPPLVVLKHVNNLVNERVVERDSLRRSRLLGSINRIVDRWNKKATLKRLADHRSLNRTARISKLGMGLTKEIYEGLGLGR